MFRLTRITVVVLAALCLGACHGNGDSNTGDQLASVYTFRPESDTDVSVSTHTSTVEEGRSVGAGFRTGGQIRRLIVDEGDYVRRGQVIGYLDDSDYRLQLLQLETQYNQLSSELRRIEELHLHNSVSDNDYEKAVAGLNQLKIQLDLVRNQLNYTQLTAPVSGHVVERMMEEGEMTGTGTPVFRIVDDAGIEASVALPAQAYAQRDRIVACTGRSAVTGDREIPLDIISFIPDGDSNSLFRLRLSIPSEYRGELLPGMSMSVNICYDSGEGSALCRVPSRALFERQGRTYVWAVNAADSVLTARQVTVTGVPEGDMSLVSGLTAADEIVAAGVHHLTDGQHVRVMGSVDNLKKNAGL